MLKEIGSNFWLDPNIDYNNQMDSSAGMRISGFEDSVFLSTGRAAQSMVLKTISERNPQINKVAVIPGYTCETVVAPFERFGYKIKCYSIDDTLEANLEEIAQLVEDCNAKVVLFHRYFGFDTCRNWNALIDCYSSKGVVFIEDKTHCLYSDLPRLNADYISASIRKWGGMPDGGIALCRKGKFLDKPEVCDEKMVQAKIEASYLKYEYMFGGKGGKDAFRRLFEEAAELLGTQNQLYKMHKVSLAVMRLMEQNDLKRKRRANYQTLYDGLEGSSKIKLLSPRLEDGVVPLYLALLAPDRNSLQQMLREQNVYAPILWPCHNGTLKVSDSVKGIYDHVLCIPIDQRYSTDDMLRVVDCFEANHLL